MEGEDGHCKLEELEKEGLEHAQKFGCQFAYWLDDQIHCRTSASLTLLECAIVPLALTGVGRNALGGDLRREEGGNVRPEEFAGGNFSVDAATPSAQENKLVFLPDISD
jgi:hypothetical protein